MENKQFVNIPKEKFAFASAGDFVHDKKLATKPRSYMHDAFSRFCKNKGALVGAIIIICLLLFSLITPFCTPYQVNYTDTYFVCTLPKSKLFAGTSFWDGCESRADGKITFDYYYAMGLETGHNAVKNQKYSISDNGLYKYRLDTYHKTGMIYRNMTMEQYADLQAYQDETGIQVIYPTVKLSDRPQAYQDSNDANYYFKTKGTTKTQIVYDEDGNIIPVYWSYREGFAADDYTSVMRIEGSEGFEVDGETYYYAYARPTSSGVECRVNYYEYYIYQHSYVAKDGISEPYFVFGTTGTGQDILTCLSSGARFSFLFGIGVALVNMLSEPFTERWRDITEAKQT